MQNPAPGLPPQSHGVVGEYEDRFGDKRIIHKTRKGLCVLRKSRTVILQLSLAIGPLLGQKIREARIASGMNGAELARKAGLAGVAGRAAKCRMYEIESGGRRHGIKIATLYAIAAALDIAPATLLPNAAEVMKAAGIVCRRSVSFTVKGQE